MRIYYQKMLTELLLQPRSWNGYFIMLTNCLETGSNHVLFCLFGVYVSVELYKEVGEATLISE
jgi:hypothetical protein